MKQRRAVATAAKNMKVMVMPYISLSWLALRSTAPGCEAIVEPLFVLKSYARYSVA